MCISARSVRESITYAMHRSMYTLIKSIVDLTIVHPIRALFHFFLVLFSFFSLLFSLFYVILLYSLLSLSKSIHLTIYLCISLFPFPLPLFPSISTILLSITQQSFFPSPNLYPDSRWAGVPGRPNSIQDKTTQCKHWSPYLP